MTEHTAAGSSCPELKIGRCAGDREPFPSGELTYLAPLPLPTQTIPYSPHISRIGDTYLEFGANEPKVFSYQIFLGGPLGITCLIALGLPLMICLVVILGGGKN